MLDMIFLVGRRKWNRVASSLILNESGVWGGEV